MNTEELYDIFRAHPVVTTDTRDCPAGSIFFALKGASFDGNAFARQALEKGCAYAVVDDAAKAGAAEAVADGRLIVVPDALRALQQLAALHRRRLATPVVQVTGTNGKTTTKELTAAVLAERFNVLFTTGNLNNHIGVPKTLLRLTAAHDVAVVETGASHPGEIAELSAITDADCGLITNVGKAHLEGFGSLEGVLRTKGELYDYLRTKPEAYVFLHADDGLLAGIAEGLPSFTYGAPGHGYDVEGEVTACTPQLHLRWRRRGGEWHTVDTLLIGAYNIDNMLAAAAVGVRFGLTDEEISHALAHYTPTNSRSELKRTDRNTLIVDAYNANPTSMRAALENFACIDHPHKMLLLGEMGELGASSAEEHRRIVELIPTAGATDVWLVGQAFREAAAGTGYRLFASADEAAKVLRAEQPAARLILVKGSHYTRLHTLPALL